MRSTTACNTPVSIQTLKSFQSASDFGGCIATISHENTYASAYSFGYAPRRRVDSIPTASTPCQRSAVVRASLRNGFACALFVSSTLPAWEPATALEIPQVRPNHLQIVMTDPAPEAEDFLEPLVLNWNEDRFMA